MNYVDEFVRKYRREGKLTDEGVVAEAADPASPLHPAFEWDDAIAGHRYRLSQARELIRRAEIVIVREDQELRVRAFVSLRDEDGYSATSDVLASSELRDRLFAQLRRDVDLLVARYERFTEAATLLDELRGWMEQHG